LGRFELPPGQKALLVKLFDRVFDCCSAALVASHTSLIELDRENVRILATK
jgi:hypothetical protein